MLSFETCEKLREAGWPQRQSYVKLVPEPEGVGDCGFKEVLTTPTLEELLEAIRDGFKLPYASVTLDNTENGWECAFGGHFAEHTDPSEAAAALWLKLKGVEG